MMTTAPPLSADLITMLVLERRARRALISGLVRLGVIFLRETKEPE